MLKEQARLIRELTADEILDEGDDGPEPVPWAIPSHAVPDPPSEASTSVQSAVAVVKGELARAADIGHRRLFHVLILPDCASERRIQANQ